MTSVVDEAVIDVDEDGFRLVLTGDMLAAFYRYIEDPDAHTVRLRLSQDAAVQLNAQVRSRVSPWVDTMEFERSAYERATSEERAAVLGLDVEELT